MNKMSYVLAILAMAITAQASITPLDSASFANKYEGDLPISGYTAYQNPNTSSYSSDGNVLTYSMDAGALFMESQTWSNPTAYTIEVRIKIDSEYADKQGAFFNFAAGPAVQDTLLWSIGASSVKTNATVGSYGSWTTQSTADNTDGFHTFRIAHDAGTGVFQMWRDGVQIATDLGYSNFSYPNYMYFIGGTGDIGGSGQIDYFRWTTGAHSPVPEPMTLILLAGGAVAMYRRK